MRAEVERLIHWDRLRKEGLEELLRSTYHEARVWLDLVAKDIGKRLGNATIVNEILLYLTSHVTYHVRASPTKVLSTFFAPAKERFKDDKDPRTLLAFIRNITSSFFVEIWCLVDSTDIVIHLYEPRIGTSFPKCTFNVNAKIQEFYQIEGLDFDISCEIDFPSFREQIIDMKMLCADTICITVYTLKRNPDEPTILLIISFNGDKVKGCFPVLMKDNPVLRQIPGRVGILEKDQLIGKLPPERDLNTIYQECFKLDGIAKFVKSLSDRAYLKLHLGDDRPMLLDYPLGSSMSSSSSKGLNYIRFICTPGEFERSVSSWFFSA